jgi:hypothetical protein
MQNICVLIVTEWLKLWAKNIELSWRRYSMLPLLVALVLSGTYSHFIFRSVSNQLIKMRQESVGLASVTVPRGFGCQ